MHLLQEVKSVGQLSLYPPGLLRHRSLSHTPTHTLSDKAEHLAEESKSVEVAVLLSCGGGWHVVVVVVVRCLQPQIMM